MSFNFEVWTAASSLLFFLDCIFHFIFVIGNPGDELWPVVMWPCHLRPIGKLATNFITNMQRNYV